jgi:tetratricopeptide (TPR) repeat protein
VIHHLGLANLTESAKKTRIERNMRLGLRKIEEFPNDAIGYIELAELILEYGNPNKAITLLQQAIRLAPGFFNCYLRLGEAYEKDGQPEEALRIYTKLQAAHPNHPLLNATLGRIAYEEGEFDQAEEHLSRSKDYLSYVRLAFARLHQNKPGGALQAAQQAVALNPERPEGKIALMHIERVHQRGGS